MARYFAFRVDQTPTNDFMIELAEGSSDADAVLSSTRVPTLEEAASFGGERLRRHLGCGDGTPIGWSEIEGSPSATAFLGQPMGVLGQARLLEQSLSEPRGTAILRRVEPIQGDTVMQAKSDLSAPSRKPRSKKPLRASFVVTVALAASGCESEVSCDDPNVACNPPIVECPAAIPTGGESCDPEVGTCQYMDDCGNDAIASCEDGSWSVDIGSCNPPPPGECPAEAPAAGAPCDPEIGSCSYTDECGSSFTVSCNGATWEVDTPIGSCNPPPPCPETLPAEGDPCELTPGGTPIGCEYDVETACGPAVAAAECVDVDEQGLVWQVTAPPCTPPEPNCFNYANAGVCEADSTCRWLVPGCGGEGDPGFAAGCFPALECTVGPNDDCGEFEECVTLNHDPCWNSNCGACGSDTNVCLPVFTNQ